MQTFMDGFCLGLGCFFFIAGLLSFFQTVNTQEQEMRLKIISVRDKAAFAFFFLATIIFIALLYKA